MSTFHPATSSLANFKNTISTISTSRFFVYISSRQEPMFVMASQIELFLPANSYTTHFICCRVHVLPTKVSRAVLEVWSIFPFAIKRILGIKRIFPCSFANKRMRLLTRVYGITFVQNLNHLKKTHVVNTTNRNSCCYTKHRPYIMNHKDRSIYINYATQKLGWSLETGLNSGVCGYTCVFLTTCATVNNKKFTRIT